MWYVIIGIVAFFFGSWCGILAIGLFFWGGRQDEEHAASVRIVDAREKISKAKKNICLCLVLINAFISRI